MGAWGTGIFSNDSACDVRDMYRGLLEDQVPDEEASQRVIAKYAGKPLEEELWLALAATQWKLGRLEPEVKRRALEAIDTEQGMDLWEGAQIRSRRSALAKLRAQLTSPQPPRRAVRRAWTYQTDLKPGDVIGVRLGERAAAVLRVVSLDEGRWVSPNLEVFFWAKEGFPSTDEIDALTAVADPLLPSFPWRVHAMKLRKRDPDWRDVGFELIAPGDGEPRERTLASSGITWEYLTRDLNEAFEAGGLT